MSGCNVNSELLEISLVLVYMLSQPHCCQRENIRSYMQAVGLQQLSSRLLKKNSPRSISWDLKLAGFRIQLVRFWR